MAQVELHHRRLRVRLAEQARQRGQALGGRQAGQPLRRQPLAAIGLGGSQPHFGPRPPVDAERGQPERAAVVRQGVKKHVRRGVVRLPGRPQQPGRGREQHKEIEWIVAGERVQIPRPGHLRSQHRCQPFCRELEQ